MTLKEAEEFTSSCRWQYAKTYPSAPHEYTCLAWNPSAKRQMVDFAYLIRDAGYTERFGNSDYRVLVIDGMKYWTMDEPLENTDLINRTYADDEKRRRIAEFVQSDKGFEYEGGMSLADIECQMMMTEFRAYVSRFDWRVAKTFEDFSPHQYILNFPCWKMKKDDKCKGEGEACVECKERRSEFEKWVLFIRKYGERCKMLKTVYTVLCVDGRQYWTMGDPLETTWVLNRALIDEPRRVPKLEWLDRE